MTNGPKNPGRPIAPKLGVCETASRPPDACGRQITIEAFNRQSQKMNWLQRDNVLNVTPLKLHGMDYVMRGMLVNDTKGP